MSKVNKPSPSMKEVIRKLKNGDNLYKWTGWLPGTISYTDSDAKVSSRTFDVLLAKGIIHVFDARACETWYELTELGKSIEL